MKKYFIDINPDLNDPTGVSAVSLVAHPAVETDFIKFSADSEDKFKNQKLHFEYDGCEHTVKGIAMLADTPIYRNNEEIGEHLIVFSKAVIKTMMLKQSMQQLQNSVNLDHDKDRFVKNAFMIESYVIDRDHGIDPVEFTDAPDGSWMVAFKILDADLWDEIEANKDFKGFSIEGLFNYALDEPTYNALDELLDELKG